MEKQLSSYPNTNSILQISYLSNNKNKNATLLPLLKQLLR
jgi:hypothetical protein